MALSRAERELTLEKVVDPRLTRGSRAKPLQTNSLPELVKQCSDEVGDPSLSLHLSEFLEQVEHFKGLSAVGIVIQAKRHLSICAIMNIDPDSLEYGELSESIGNLHDDFTEAIEDRDNGLTTSLSYATTIRSGLPSTIRALKTRWKCDPTVSLITFATKQ